MANFVRVSEGTTLALHTLTLLAKRQGEVVSTRELALSLKASFDHLTKVMQKLTKSGFVDASRGPLGGFTLKRQAKEITLLEVFLALEGALKKDECPLAKPFCISNGCALGKIVCDVEQKISKFFEETTLADVAGSITL